MINEIRKHKDNIIGIFGIMAWLGGCYLVGCAIGQILIKIGIMFGKSIFNHKIK